VNFDGSAPITVTAAAGTLSGATLAANVLASSLTSLGTIASLSATKALAGDGTSGAPAYSFTSEPTLGFWRSGAGQLTLQGGLTVTGVILSTAHTVGSLSRGTVIWNADGHPTISNNAQTVGARLKVDALPTVASGFGTSPSVTAGSTPLAGSVNVGTGGSATSGVINFNGTAFPAAPFVVCMNTTTGAVVRATASTTQLTITAPVAFVASDVICWHCISSK
jgi:hypothetical protein